MRPKQEHCSKTCSVRHRWPPLAERFWVKVNREGPPSDYRPDLGPCWIWTGAKHGQPGRKYGTFRQGGRVSQAHRVAWELLRGPCLEGLEPDHLCRVTLCVNPSHLEWVTTQVNALRGTSTAASNAQKTQCLRGHPYDLLNTIFHADGHRECRLCRQERNRGSRVRRAIRGREAEYARRRALRAERKAIASQVPPVMYGVEASP